MITVTPSHCALHAADLGSQVAAAVAQIAPEARHMLLALAHEMGIRYPNRETKKPQRMLRLVSN